MPNTTIQLIREAVNEASQILVTTHIGPDGDAIGSLIAMGLILQRMGKHVDLISDDGVPKRFRYLPLSETVVQEPPIEEKYDLFIALDAGDLTRVGKVFRKFPEPLPPIINIDHHVTNTRFGQINLVDEAACSTTEILFKLLPELGVSLNSALAECLLTGLITDTLDFRTANVTGQTLRTAATLVEAGVDLHHTTTQALTLKELPTLLLWKKGLNNAQIEDGFIWTVITNEDRREVGHQGFSTYGLGNMLADVYDIHMSAVLLELSDGRVTVGFRSQPPFSVSELAAELGGGGHHLAAGCTIRGSLEEVTTLVVSKSREALRRQEIEQRQHTGK
ncbi:MAG: bifunctional oligoribonuclease/PAP phosphatase NrnA [Candidatus Promineifilaceae bacterium]